MRQFVRHPSDVPIQVQKEAVIPRKTRKLNNVSMFGLSFRSETAFEPGCLITLGITAVNPPFSAKARVVWCRKKNRHYNVGVELLSRKDQFRARMVEQVCHIEHYKNLVYEREGRSLSGEQAAREWIDRHAAEFPRIRVGQKG